MPIRFSTEAANADVLGEDTDSGSAKDGTPERAVADGKSADRFTRNPQHERKRGGSADGDAKPGKDINAAGFSKDKDEGKP